MASGRCGGIGDGSTGAVRHRKGSHQDERFKSAIKTVVPEDAEGRLVKWVALLTGSKNALKGLGFFLGGFLLATLGFSGGLWAMAACLGVVLGLPLSLPAEIGRAKAKQKFATIFSHSPEIDWLSAARFFLFASRDAWFVVGLRIFLTATLGWQAIRQGFTVFYRSIFDAVRELHDEENSHTDTRTLSRYLKPDLLILDDMGTKQLPPKAGEHFFEIIMRRYEVRSTLMTSNRPIEEWGKLIGDVPAATAILDRFLHHAKILNIFGRFYRLKDRLQAPPDLHSKPATQS